MKLRIPMCPEEREAFDRAVAKAKAIFGSFPPSHGQVGHVEWSDGQGQRLHDR